MHRPQRRRKQRDTVACQPCRQRKVRCDGMRPACRTCGRRNIQCSYGEDPSSTHEMAESTQPVTETLGWPPSPRRDPDTSRYEGNMFTAQGQSGGPSRESQFFGDSSVASLLQRIQDAPAENSSTTDPVRPGGLALSASRLLKPAAVHFEFEDYSLPPRSLADHLLECYWAEVHSLYPFIHRPTFMHGYSRLWNPEGSTEAQQTPTPTPLMGLGDDANCSPLIFYYALNAMFALGCQFSALAGEERAARSEVFRTRSNRLLQQVDLLGQGNLSLVQALLVNAHYLQSTAFADRCWNTVGLACRMAQGVGLHSTDHDGRWSDQEVQMRRCLWHACVMLDLSTSMALGRPSMTSRLARLPLPDPGGPDTPDVSDTQAREFFLHNMKLFYIMGDILSRVYEAKPHPDQPESSGSDKETSPAVREIELSLFFFYEDLPRPLQWGVSDPFIPERAILCRQMTVLHARYLHLKILLFRPTLSRFYRSTARRTGEEPSSISPSIGLEGSCRCVEAARALIRLLADTAEPARPAWWYSVLYMFTAGVVLILAQLSPDLTEWFSKEGLAASWELCLSYLEQDVPYGHSARKCAHDLRKAYHLVSTTQERAPVPITTPNSDMPHHPPDNPGAWEYHLSGSGEDRQNEDSLLADILWDDFISSYTASFAFFEAIWEAGITHVFVNLGSDHPSIMEAMIKGKRERPDAFPRIITCPSEMVAMSMADGYARLTNRPQCVIIHVDVGTQALGPAVHNASCGRAPVLVFAGLSPFTIEGEMRGSRTEFIHWIQDVPDQTQIVRQYCRYTGELKTGHNVKQMVNRALQFATSDPKGPVYLVGAREVMEQEIQPYTVEQKFWSPTAPTALPATAVPAIASILLNAKNPLCITGYSGRNHEAVDALVALVNTVRGMRVLDTGISDMCFPANHRGWLGSRYGVHEAIPAADAILVLDCDVPWIPTRCRPSPGARVIHIDVDPLKQQMPVFYLDAEMRFKADAATACHQIVEHISNDVALRQLTLSPAANERWDALGRSHQAFIASIADAAKPTQANMADDSFGTAYLIRTLRDLAPKDAIFAVEAVTNTPTIADQIQATLPGSWINCGGGGLGWSTGGALGVKLASDDLAGGEGKGKMVIQIVGDGTFMFSVPSSGFWISQRYKIPILTIVLNNRGWNAPRVSMQLVHPDGLGSRATNDELNIAFSPAPDYSGIARAASNHTAFAAKVEHASKLEQVLRDAIESVQGGTTAVVDAVVRNPIVGVAKGKL